MTLANYVTLARIALIPLVILFLLGRVNGLAAVFFLVLSFSDAIDGYIARRLNQVSELGKILDPIADKILVITVLIALVGLQKADPVPVMILLVREFLVQGVRISASQEKKVIAAIPLAKWKTAAHVLAVFMLILSLPLANLALWISVILSLVSGGVYAWRSKILKQLKLS